MSRLDPNIPLSAIRGGVQPEGPLDWAQKAYSLQNMRDVNRANQFKLQQEQEQAARQKQALQIMGQSPDDETTIKNLQAAGLADFAQEHAKFVIDRRTRMAQMSNEEAKQSDQHATKLAGMADQLINAPEDQRDQVYAGILQAAQMAGEDISQYPREVPPDYVLKSMRSASTGYLKDRAALEQTREQTRIAQQKAAQDKAAGEIDLRKKVADWQQSQQQAAGTTPITPYQQAQLGQLTPGTETPLPPAVEAQRIRIAQASRADTGPGTLPGGGGLNTGTIHGPDFLKTLAPPVAAQVKALAEGRLQFPTGTALRAPYWQQMLDAVAAYDPSFDAINYNARAKTRADFTSGKSAQAVNAINTVVGHLTGLQDAAGKLNNTSIPFVNSVKNWLGSAAGAGTVVDFDTAKQAVANELTRVYRQAGGSEADIREWEQNLNSAQSPKQFKAVFTRIGELLESKLEAMQNQQDQGMGIASVNIITPKARENLNKLVGVGGEEAGAGTVIDPAGQEHYVSDVEAAIKRVPGTRRK